MRLLFVVFSFLVPHVIFPQRQNIWYFGDDIGLDFNYGQPHLLIDGRIHSDGSDSESAAVISDKTGQLLFYTDGVSVWNRDHVVMPNGDQLWGAKTTTQTIIIPKPGSDKLYYIFTASPQGDDSYFPDERKGFRYSVVDISLDSGYGDVVEKNLLLEKSTTEKISATHHANNRDVWVVMHEWNNNTFRSFLVTSEGISKENVSSDVGSIHGSADGGANDGRNAIGQMKISPNGEKLALAIYESSMLEIFNFDSATGKLSNAYSFKNPSGENGSILYGVEFSPNSKLLYVSDALRFVYQIDLSQSTPKLAARLGSGAVLNDQPGALQLAPNGKIYVARYLRSFIGAITQPDLSGDACEYNSEEIELPVEDTAYYCNLGLPNFISTYFLDEELYPPKPFFEMPNVFTPNGDGINEMFIPTRSFNVKSAEVTIYNRWGEAVYHASNLEPGWDGSKNSPGVYFWCVHYEGINRQKYIKKGVIHLVL